MSTNIIFTVPGRTTNYMPIDVNEPKEAILEKYARESYSTENTWPYDSPSAGYYDITNSDTKLILLNKRITWSHLRGKTKPKREPFIKDEFYDWVEKELEMKAQSEKNSNSSRDHSASRRTIDPSRHFSAIGCTFKPDFKEESANTFKSKSLSKSAYSWSRGRIGTAETKKNKELTSQERNQLLKYFYEMSTRKVGLHDKTHVKNPPYEFINSYNINHPELKKGQKLFLSNLCQVYSVSPLKKSKKSQYIGLLERQKEIDKWSRDKFRMHDGENFSMYRDYIKSERPVPNFVNCGYLHPKQTTKNASAPPKSNKRAFYTEPSSSTKQADDTILSANSTETYSSQSTTLNSDNDKEQKGKVLSDLSNTNYESSSLSSESAVSSNSSKSEKKPDTSRSLSQISHLSNDSNSKSSFSSSADSKSVSKSSLVKAESSSDKPGIQAEQDQSALSQYSRSSSPLETSKSTRSEFMNSSRVPSSQKKAPSKAPIKTPTKASANAPKSKPIQIVRKSEDEEE